MQTAETRRSNLTVLLGTVMRVDRYSNGVVHRVEATGPDGDRIVIDVFDRKRHTGAVRVVWDPLGVRSPSLAQSRPRHLAILAPGLAALTVVAWYVSV